MLILYDLGGTGHPLDIDDYYVRYLASGLDEVVFKISVYDRDYQYVQEEAKIKDRNLNTYVIKQIDAGTTEAKVVAQIDLNDWKATIQKNYSNGNKSPYNTINGVKPTGWAVNNQSGITTKRNIPASSSAQPYSVTPWEIVTAVENTWGLRVRVDNASKILYIVNPASYTPTGAFATKDLNLKKLNYKGKSSGYVTRLYAEGKDGLTFADINSGNDYVDNNTYSNAVICSYWKDERYTDATSLLNDATKKLADMAVPQSSYSLDVIDLAATNSSYSILNMDLFQMVTLMDDTKKTAVNHQVVEKWDYPHYPEKNKVVLSTVTPAIQNQVASVVTSLEVPTSPFQQILQAAINAQTEAITGNSGGYVVLHDSNGDGEPDELLIMNTADISTATNVWRWNLAGLGFSSTGYNGTFTTAITGDGKISADFITTGTLNANLVNVINLIAEALSCETANGDYKVDIENGYFSIWKKMNGSWVKRVGIGNDTTNAQITDGAITIGYLPDLTTDPSTWTNSFVLIQPLSSYIKTQWRNFGTLMMDGTLANLVFTNGAMLEGKDPNWVKCGGGYVLEGGGTDPAPRALQNLKELADGDDLNNLTACGSYCIRSTSIGNNISHKPIATGMAGIIIVESRVGATGGAATYRYIRQQFYPHGGYGFWERRANTGSGTTYTWTEWYKVGGLQELDTDVSLPITSGSVVVIGQQYSKLVIVGRPSSGTLRVSTTVPVELITSTATRWQINDEANFVSFDLVTVGDTFIKLTIQSNNNSGRIMKIYGEV